MKLKIGVITNYEYSDEERASRSTDRKCEFVFAEGMLSRAVGIGLHMQNNLHVHAVLTTSLTSRYLKKELDIPVLPLKLRNYDIIRALLRAKQLGKHPAFLAVDTLEVEYDFEEIRKLLGFPVRYYKFTGFDGFPDTFRQIMADGCDVIVSIGNVSIPLVKDRGMKTVCMTPDIRTFQEAVAQVKYIYADREKEAWKSKWINAIVNEISDGILAWEKSGKIAVFNHAAQRAFRLEPAAVLNRHIDEFSARVPESKDFLLSEREYTVTRLGGQDHIIRSREVRDAENVLLGRFIRVSELQQIKNMEMFARREMSKKGFVAEYSFSDIIGTSARLREVKATAQKYAQSDVNILISGESGSGKEVFAQSIHNFSGFSDGPFVAVNCTSLSDNLLESELFGYEDGAFTGAKKGGKPGLFELAHGGTLFLDEIGDMPLHLQVKLLRVLQERTVRRVGGSKNIPVNVRFIFATNQNIRDKVRRREFREDLYYRINVLSLHIPALRERPEDIAVLAEDIAAGVCRRTGRDYFFPADCEDIIQRYNWPGNVRELSNFMERIIVLKINDRAAIRNMIGEMSSGVEPISPFPASGPPADDGGHVRVGIGSMRQMENEIILSLMGKYGGDKKKLAWILGLSGTTLWRRFKEIEEQSVY